MTTSIPLPAGLPLDAASWEQTPLVVRQVIVQLLAVIQQQAARIAALEARLSQNSRNSDRPPSSDPPFVTRPSSSTTKGTPGAKPGHPGHRQALLAPTEVIEVKPEACACGQQEFPATTPYYTHQVIELPEIQMAVTACRVARGALSSVWPPPQSRAACGVPLRVWAPVDGAHRGAVGRSAGQSHAQCRSFAHRSWGCPSAGARFNARWIGSRKPSNPITRRLRQKARSAQVNYIDETAWYQHGVLAWLWVMVNTTVALFTVQASRSKAAFEALVERWAGILVSDGYGVYRHWLHGRQTCLAHLIRRARGLSERHDPELAWFGRRVMAELQRLVHWATAPPTSGEVQTWYARMVHLLAQYRQRQDEAGTFARTLEREMGGPVDVCGGGRRGTHQQPR